MCFNVLIAYRKAATQVAVLPESNFGTLKMFQTYNPSDRFLMILLNWPHFLAVSVLLDKWCFWITLISVNCVVASTLTTPPSCKIPFKSRSSWSSQTARFSSYCGACHHRKEPKSLVCLGDHVINATALVFRMSDLRVHCRGWTPALIMRFHKPFVCRRIFESFLVIFVKK